MKKLFIFAMILLTGLAAFAQLTPADSQAIQDQLNFGFTIANTIRPQPWIKGIDNEIISGVVTAVASLVLGIIARRREKKKLRKSGKLQD